MSVRVLRYAVCVLVVVLQGCAMIPPEPVVIGPLTAPPEPAAVLPAAETNGAIYQPTAYGNYPLFEDRRPRNVGDIVTVLIQEKTNAAKSVQTSTGRNASAGFEASLVPDFLPDALKANQNLDMRGKNALEGKGATSANNMFAGTLTTTVVGVLPNGNLQIAGDKQIAINRGSEHIRFSGVVDPRSVTGSNTVLSTQVADARIEFRSKGTMDEVQTMGWLQRFFLNVSPF
ncbi:flagellar basal body L-ring protein FlgH [Alcaligenaceae bacterium]|nr:flagellar basal body L-ring protein FlgH [Alcaligenaceae bacterium]